MNETGMPMPPSNLPSASPPSYLRPPMRPAPGHLRQSSTLLLVVGIAAVVLCAWGYLLLRGSSPLPVSTAQAPLLTGGIIYMGATPVSNVYHFSFAQHSNDPLLAAPAKAIVENAAVTSGLTVLARVESAGQSNALVVTSLADGSKKTVATTQGGSIYPAWSFDGKYLAFLALSPNAIAKSLAFVPFTPTTTAALPPQKLHAALSIQNPNGKTATYGIVGRPLGFSIDNGYLLIKNIQVVKSVFFSVVDAQTGKTYPLVANIPNPPSIAALSPNGAYLAFTDGKVVSWGQVNWSAKAFTPRGIITMKTDGISFSPQGDLLLYAGGTARGYRLDGSEAKLIGTAAVPFMSGTPVLMWLTQ